MARTVPRGARSVVTWPGDVEISVDRVVDQPTRPSCATRSSSSTSTTTGYRDGRSLSCFLRDAQTAASSPASTASRGAATRRIDTSGSTRRAAGKVLGRRLLDSRRGRSRRRGCRDDRASSFRCRCASLELAPALDHAAATSGPPSPGPRHATFRAVGSAPGLDRERHVVDDAVAELVSPSTPTTPRARACVAGPATTGEPGERAPVERDAWPSGRRARRRAAPRDPRAAPRPRRRSAASPRPRTRRVLPGGAPAFLPTT